MIRSEIVIKKVHNGWIVQLPEPSKSSIASDIMANYMQQLPRMLNQINDDSDDVMAKIRQANEVGPEEDFIQERNMPEALIDTAENILIFQTFPEVLEFLDNNIGNG